MGTWSDLSAWWKRLWNRRPSEEYLPVSPESDVGEAAAAPAKPGRLIHWPVSRRDRQLAALQEGYVEMLGLMRGIREHLEKQQGVQEKMVQVLDRLPDSMDGLKNVGRAAEQQVEVMSLLRKQIESGATHDQQLIDSMNRFNQTLGVMDQTSRSSGRAVEQLIVKAADSEKMLRDAMERSERRFMIVTAVFAVVAVLAAGAVMFLVWANRAASPREALPAPSIAREAPPPAASADASEALPPGAIPVPTEPELAPPAEPVPPAEPEPPPIAMEPPASEVSSVESPAPEVAPEPAPVVEPAPVESAGPAPAAVETDKPVKKSRRHSRRAPPEPAPAEPEAP
ncbi:MAG TPA: hypothetical protein P5567_10780 [Kiritimatiellia bacterium]|nr:hypothetical protein [Kiritimatiellia bacterium]HRZ12925.1 hypothetical protein [Kiritimatiellia bacterium]HSA18465.1 hypothetical protein [Kiritimatiellia bacterium]